jgi:hypothetical protein
MQEEEAKHARKVLVKYGIASTHVVQRSALCHIRKDMYAIEFTTRTYNLKNLAVGSCVRMKIAAPEIEF